MASYMKALSRHSLTNRRTQGGGVGQRDAIVAASLVKDLAPANWPPCGRGFLDHYADEGAAIGVRGSRETGRSPRGSLR